MPALNGYGTLTEETDSAGSTSIEDTAAETFITNGLAKVLKINNICDNDHLADCGINQSFTDMVGSRKTFPKTLSEINSQLVSMSYSYSWGAYSHSQIDTKAAAFETANGESILLFYNPNCLANMGETRQYYSQPKMCANFVYDLNGTKGPNTVGKDMGFISVLYPSDSLVVAPVPVNKLTGRISQYDAGAECRELDSDSRVPNRGELASLFYNYYFTGFDDNTGDFWSSEPASATNGWYLQFAEGVFHSEFSRSYTNPRVRCIKR